MTKNDTYHTLRKKTYDIVENRNYDSTFSLLFDKFLITLILLNVAAVVAESVDSIFYPNRLFFYIFEYFSIFIFSLEYWIRLWCVVESEEYENLSPWQARRQWIFTPGAMIDFISIFPAYINFFVKVDLRFLRVLRLFRLLKLTRYFAAMRVLLVVIRKEKDSFKAVLFILVIMIIVASSGIYVVENRAQPEVFESIPKSMWWAVVTLTTVGYGDVIPITPLGKFFGAAITILGVGLAALPAGILASGLASELERRRDLLEQNFRTLLLDKDIDLTGSYNEIEIMREEVGLNRHQAKEVIIDILNEQNYQKELMLRESHKYCPHCGESIDDPNSN